MSYIGRNLKWYRKRKKISQTELANIFSITRASVGAYEEERSDPKMELIIRFANYFDISLDDFITKDLQFEKKSETPSETKEISSLTFQDLFQEEEDKPEKLSPEKTPTPEISIPETVKNEEHWNIDFSMDGVQNQILTLPKIPPFSLSDFILQLTPAVERPIDLLVNDGSWLWTKKITDFGVYQGTFLVKKNQQYQLIKGSYTFQSPTEKAFRVLYITDSVHNLL
jgi:transcriptional regulator with XRE-family HTH domain